MAEQVARTFSQAQLGKVDEEDGRTARAPLPSSRRARGWASRWPIAHRPLPLRLARGTRVLISTATVALQEQLVNKDLPALAAQMEQPFQASCTGQGARALCVQAQVRAPGGHPDDAAHGEDA